MVLAGFVRVEDRFMDPEYGIVGRDPWEKGLPAAAKAGQIVESNSACDDHRLLIEEGFVDRNVKARRGASEGCID